MSSSASKGDTQPQDTSKEEQILEEKYPANNVIVLPKRRKRTVTVGTTEESDKPDEIHVDMGDLTERFESIKGDFSNRTSQEYEEDGKPSKRCCGGRSGQGAITRHEKIIRDSNRELDAIRKLTQDYITFQTQLLSPKKPSGDKKTYNELSQDYTKAAEVKSIIQELQRMRDEIEYDINEREQAFDKKQKSAVAGKFIFILSIIGLFIIFAQDILPMLTDSTIAIRVVDGVAKLMTAISLTINTRYGHETQTKAENAMKADINSLIESKQDRKVASPALTIDQEQEEVAPIPTSRPNPFSRGASAASSAAIKPLSLGNQVDFRSSASNRSPRSGITAKDLIILDGNHIKSFLASKLNNVSICLCENLKMFKGFLKDNVKNKKGKTVFILKNNLNKDYLGATYYTALVYDCTEEKFYFVDPMGQDIPEAITKILPDGYDINKLLKHHNVKRNDSSYNIIVVGSIINLLDPDEPNKDTIDVEETKAQILGSYPTRSAIGM